MSYQKDRHPRHEHGGEQGRNTYSRPVIHLIIHLRLTLRAEPALASLDLRARLG